MNNFEQEDNNASLVWPSKS